MSKKEEQKKSLMQKLASFLKGEGDHEKKDLETLEELAEDQEYDTFGLEVESGNKKLEIEGAETLDAVDVGQMVYEIDEEGNKVKAEAGEYKLSDSMSIFVDAEGYINEIRTDETGEMEAMEEEKEMEAMEEMKKEYEDKLAKAKAEILKEVEQKESEETEKVLNELLSELKTLKPNNNKQAGFEAKPVTNNRNMDKKIKGKPAYAKLAKRLGSKNEGNDVILKNANVVSDNFDYTYDGILSTETLYKPSVQTPDILQIFTVRDGIKYKEQLLLANNLSNIVRAAQTCGTQTANGNTTLFNRTIETTNLEVYIEQCEDDFEATVLTELVNAGVDRWDLTGTELESVILNLVLDAMRRDNFRIFSFGDTSAVSANYSQLDGLWTRLIAGTADYCTKQVDNITTLNNTAGSTAEDYLRNLHEGAEIILKQIPNAEKRFFVTGNIYENYMTQLEARNATEAAYMQLTDGSRTLSFRGIPVVPVYAWDQALADINNPLFGQNSFMLYTTPKNHVIGVEQAAEQGRAEFWYDKDTKLNKVRAGYKMGYNYVHCDLSAISWGPAA